MKDLRDLYGLAERQHGLLTSVDLSRASVGDQEVAGWVESGRVTRVGYGVYRVGGCPPSTEARVLASILVHPTATWASHRTAAWLWGVDGFAPPGRVDVTRLHEASNRRTGPRVHRTTRMPPHHVTVLKGIPVTTLPRTIFDLGWSLGPRSFDRLAEAGLRTSHCTVGALYRMLEDLGGRGRPGTVAMREVLAVRGEGYVPTESELDVLGRAVVASVAGFEWQVPMADEQGYIRRVDGLLRRANLVVEWDGAEFHHRDDQRRLDDEGDRRLQALGLAVVRFGWADVTASPGDVRAVVRSHLPTFGTATSERSDAPHLRNPAA